jgi:DNA (cytosine-5)-methyltransferase 3A
MFCLRSQIDILIGGSPCSNLSISVINSKEHNQELDGEKSKLFFEICKSTPNSKTKVLLD